MAAVELENACIELSKKLPELGLPTYINSFDDLNTLRPHVEAAVASVNIWQYYVFDVQTSVKQVHSTLESDTSKRWSEVEQLADIVKRTQGMIKEYRMYSSRFCTQVQPEVAAGFLKAAFPDSDPTAQAASWGRILDIINLDLYAECNDDLAVAVDNMLGRLRYTRLDEDGPRMGEINEEYVPWT